MRYAVFVGVGPDNSWAQANSLLVLFEIKAFWLILNGAFKMFLCWQENNYILLYLVLSLSS